MLRPDAMPSRATASEAAVAAAADRLRVGEPVAFPTETVYGLGADTFSAAAIERVYALKGRPADNPLIAHVLDADQARRVAAVWDDRADLAARSCWPGPLTIVVPRAAGVPRIATAGWPSIAVRAPAHPVARRLLEAFGGPISAPSANRSGGVSPTTADHVTADFADHPDLLVLDGGPCAIGIESTVVDLTGLVARLLRPGPVGIERLRAMLGEVAVTDSVTQAPSPGTTLRHYAPQSPTLIVDAAALADRLAETPSPATVLCFDAAAVPPPHRAIAMPATPEAYAARLYAALREADRGRPERILVVRPPSVEGLWKAVGDRLRRATA